MNSGHREIELSVSADDAWRALIAPGRREWYFGLTPEGEVVAGGHLRWVDAAGNVAVESDVVELRSGEHLSLRDRFVFAPNMAAFEPHLTTWTCGPGARAASSGFRGRQTRRLPR